MAHFMGTPIWAEAAVTTAIERTHVNAEKWTVPLEVIGRYESNWGNNANLCEDPALNSPLGSFQLARGMFKAANERFPGLVPSIRIADPECSAIVAILYINSQLTGYGGYGGIGQLDGKVGLLPRTDRGPGELLRYYAAHPTAGVEELRPLYKGY